MRFRIHETKMIHNDETILYYSQFSHVIRGSIMTGHPLRNLLFLITIRINFTKLSNSHLHNVRYAMKLYTGLLFI